MGELATLKLFLDESNVWIHHTKKYQNRQPLISTKHCQLWQIMGITMDVSAKFGCFSILIEFSYKKYLAWRIRGFQADGVRIYLQEG